MKACKQGDSILYDCPGCGFLHAINISPGNGKPCWTWNGSLESPTFSPSVHVAWGHSSGKKVCHSFVRDGVVQLLSDCTQNADTSLAIPEWED